MDTRKLLEKITVEPESAREADERGCAQPRSFSPALCYHSLPTKTSTSTSASKKDVLLSKMPKPKLRSTLLIHIHLSVDPKLRPYPTAPHSNSDSLLSLLVINIQIKDE